jgi:hypothetical protein
MLRRWIRDHDKSPCTRLQFKPLADRCYRQGFFSPSTRSRRAQWGDQRPVGT